MNINIYNDYRLIIKTRTSYRVDVDDFSEELNETVIEKESGDQVVERISKLMTDDHFMSIMIKDNMVHVEGFNPNTGEDYTINIQMIVLESEELPF